MGTVLIVFLGLFQNQIVTLSSNAMSILVTYFKTNCNIIRNYINSLNGEKTMTSAALNIAKQIDGMTESEVDFLWDFLSKRRNETLLKAIDMKLEESL